MFFCMFYTVGSVFRMDGKIAGLFFVVILIAKFIKGLTTGYYQNSLGTVFRIFESTSQSVSRRFLKGR